ncbi:MAG: histidine kinase dimerization/phosphoacceptor domain -containing protein [bacterium]
MRRNQTKTKKAGGHWRGGRIWQPVACMFAVLFVLVWLNEIFDLPHHVLGTIQTPINWAQALIESAVVLVVGVLTIAVLIRNASRRLEAEQVVVEARDRAQMYLDVAGVILLVIDSNQTVGLINKKGCEILGYEEGDIVGKNWFDHFLPERWRERARFFFEQLMNGKKGLVEYYEGLVLTSQGKERIIAWHNTVLKDEAGTATGIMCSGADITERKAMEEALRERTRDLARKVNEINCLYAISRFMERRDTSLQAILQGIVDLIPLAWQDPEIICARISLEGVAVTTSRFDETPLKHSSDILVHGRKIGSLEVFCIEKHPSEPPLFVEERDLLETIAERLGKIIERKRSEDESRRLKQQIEFILGATNTGLDIIDPLCNIVYVDPAWKKRYGNPGNKRCYEYFMGRNTICPGCGAMKALKKRDIVVHEQILTREGNRPIQVTSIPFQNEMGDWLVAEINVDITERKQAEEKIRQSLVEKEALLREVHHRVKNNLQIISSLLKLQAERVQDENLKRVYQESKGRISSIALVHEILYHSEDLAEIDLRQYIIYISRNIFKIFGVLAKDIDITVDVHDINLGINQAVPIGLVLNEIISNSLKHAFSESGKGEIRISAHTNGDGAIELTVNDNGKGIPDGIDYHNAKTLGLRLIKGLVEEQLKGEIILQRNQGTRYTIRFNRKDL